MSSILRRIEYISKIKKVKKTCLIRRQNLNHAFPVDQHHKGEIFSFCSDNKRVYISTNCVEKYL